MKNDKDHIRWKHIRRTKNRIQEIKDNLSWIQPGKEHLKAIYEGSLRKFQNCERHLQKMSDEEYIHRFMVAKYNFSELYEDNIVD